MLLSGRIVTMHCRGGVGRAAMIAACVALELELVKTAADAISLLRKRRAICLLFSLCHCFLAHCQCPSVPSF
jgi:protein-tyrosine phosphatase